LQNKALRATIAERWQKMRQTIGKSGKMAGQPSFVAYSTVSLFMQAT